MELTLKDCVDNLMRVINGRNVAILLPGYSLHELIERKEEFKKFNLCTATVNDFWLIEEQFGNVDIAMCSAAECGVPTDRHIEYLDRKDDNLFVTESLSFKDQSKLDDVMEKYPKKLFFFAAEQSGIYPFLKGKGARLEAPMNFLALPSFTTLIIICSIIKVPTVFLFGADGGKLGKDLYCMPDWGKGAKIAGSLGRLLYDTSILNGGLWAKTYKQVCDLYEVEPPRIINCSEKSYYNIFEKMSYDKTWEVLND